MELAIIADDLTGANDTGVQLARRGLKTSVLIQMEAGNEACSRLDAVVLDTDSRAASPEEAYRRVKEASVYVRQLGCGTIYKKMDSTLRGNIGVELDAVFDAVEPELIVLAPAFPQTGRLVRDGILYVNGIPVHETAAGSDPKTPVKESHIPTLLKLQTKREVGLIDHHDLRQGGAHMQQKLSSLLDRQIRYILFDSGSESDLRTVANCIEQSGRRVVWAGSAGLANFLPMVQASASTDSATESNAIQANDAAIGGEERSGKLAAKLPVLLVVGSVNGQSRKQLDALLRVRDAVQPVKLQAYASVEGGAAKDAELARICREAEASLRQGMNVALFSSGDQADIDRANEVGRRFGLDPTAVSERVADMLGEAAAMLMKSHPLQGVVLTGGDTAKQVCLHWGAYSFELLDELESGIPRGRLIGDGRTVEAVTKAGGFGSEQVLIRAIGQLRGEDTTA
ncbi:four-carbon acid sugar kinase family protein [Paenibacillus piri]|uniref:Four-carbon acid sugar kinase family protein n=1 Tax=Paenibacillus piri TaxID=2547395 RepID=A0A4R5KX57_9BACL|nr:four-carbon acid sugar kinase family protein [Paenibacillus piri]TDF99768.1 four-carbon acid sugar kinase family protein [Paenibacillus piri]